MPGIKANNTARARIVRTCGILKGKKNMVQELLRQRAEDKKKEDRHYKAKKRKWQDKIVLTSWNKEVL